MIEVLIMSNGKSELCRKAVESVEKQNFSKNKFSWRVVHNSNGVSRENELQKSEAAWVLFLDEDCELPDNLYLLRAQEIIDQSPTSSYFGGFYLSKVNAPYSVKAYNQLCNAWVLNSQSKKSTYNLLGGCLLVRANSVRWGIKENPISWGGEDTYMLRKWQESGRWGCVRSELSVYHCPEKQTFKKLKSRAYVHGQHRYIYNLGTKSISSEGVTYALKNIKYWPVWFAHFAYVAAGSTVQKIGPIHKN